MTATRLLGSLLAALLAACPVSAQTAPAAGASPSAPVTQPASAPPLLGDQTDGSRARPVHRIPLRDSEGEIVRTTDTPLLPFSARHTCGADCHHVPTISRGWHFNTMTPGGAGVRRGEPWILADMDAATQLPLSSHGWQGTFRPEQVGLTPFAFARSFGGRTPGGIGGAAEPGAGLRARWVVSGELEPNCLVCHDASPGYDHSEYGRQIALENFRWAVAAASGMTLVTGAAKEMPNFFDYLMPRVEDALGPRMPAIAYAPERFLPGAKVVFDIVREVPARRCYICHTSADVAHTGQGRWDADADIHLARGMTCIDCHRNGLDHAMTRGYDGDPASGPGRAALSCRGCHMAQEADRVFARGRVGAPYPRHAGLPPIHLDTLSCTACHSGPRPEATTRRLKTSQAHRLGGLNVNKAPDALPHLYYPVFARDEDGPTTPNRLLWPAYWGRMTSGRVTPLLPERVKAVMAKGRVQLKRSSDGNWASLDTKTLATVLALLASDTKAEGTPVYVAGGRLYRLGAAGDVAAEEHAAAQPYLWPIAHDVRPASLALGARGCQDCHDESAPIFFGQVPVDSPIASARADSWPMSRFQKGLDTTYVADFARTFQYRPWLKGTVVATAAVLLVFVLGYVLAAMGGMAAAAARARWLRVAANVLALAACGTSVATGLPALLSGESLTGYRLMIHVGGAPLLAGGAVLLTVFWAHRNRLGRGDWNRVRRPVGRAASHEASSYAVLLRKLAFWIAVAAVVPAVASATLAMFPFLASVWQPALFAVHRCAVTVIVCSASLFVVLALFAWIRKHPDFPGQAPGAAPRT